MLDNLLNDIVSSKTYIEQYRDTIKKESTLDDLYKLIQKDNYVGEVVELEYKSAVVQINDHFREKVGGVASQTFLIATRINPAAPEFPHIQNMKEHEKEDCCAILLRVLNSADLPQDLDRKRNRSEFAQKSNDTGAHWEQSLDGSTKLIMSFSGVQCRVIGTFYLREKDDSEKLELCFGSDLSNFYPNRGLKVYKPKDEALSSIVNFGVDENQSINIGAVRYASTQRTSEGISNVSVRINPDDLVAQKTAIFGMTRTGKSNTVKTIVKAIYQMRFLQFKPKKIGQIIFDPNGEYANENLQDKDDKTGQAQAIKNLYKIAVNGKMGDEADIKVYSLSESKNDENRTMMKINFFDDNLIHVGKTLIDNKIESDGANTSSHYMRNFINLSFERPDDSDHSASTRYKRRLLVYKTLLVKAGFSPGKNRMVDPCDLFGTDFLNALSTGIEKVEQPLDEGDDGSKVKEVKEPIKYDEKRKSYHDAYETLHRLSTKGATYDELFKAFQVVNQFIQDQESTYPDFNRNYIRNSSSKMSWADNDLEVLLVMFEHSNASKQIGKAKVFHNENAKNGDYADMIYRDLSEGKLVIVDQALGESGLNKIAASRIVDKIFRENSKKFADAQNPSDILIFVEEAHNLMPKGSEEDTTNIWARVAKEGAKFKIGMIYSTQEVSSIQRNILKNTTNWFISHLNNKEEVRALEDYYDFEDFSRSILSAEDKGFIRMKTRSNKFIVPVQIDKFQVR